MIAHERVKYLNQRDVIMENPYVLYWMQSSQRAEWNHALEYAIEQANRLEKPLLVFFGITDRFPEANARHYRFMLEGIREVKETLAKRRIKLLIRNLSPELGALELSSWAALLVTDRGYLRIEREWRRVLAQKALCPVVQVETNVIVPIEEASSKEEYSAATLRGKISKQIEGYRFPLEERSSLHSSLGITLPFSEFHCDDIEEALTLLNLDRAVTASLSTGGTNQAKQRLEDFIDGKLSRYSELKNEPGEEFTSQLSAYLHFGQISPLYIDFRITEAGPQGHSEGIKVFLEELIVRRELSMNFVYYNDAYDTYSGLPAWAKNTLSKHAADQREVIYSREELEGAKTHDAYWNAAQKELRISGGMHGYMRMYWGKKILEWSQTPEEAYQTALYLNNKYALDGRDPNGFAGVAWCFGKHDRPWGERGIFGMIRYMNDKGLKRKFDMNKYLRKVESLGQDTLWDV